MDELKIAEEGNFMADDIKVSVIVPVYNSAPYLRQCLDSIVEQTLREIEIICVDDGSTDESPSILEEYAAADARLSVLHQQNQYAGVARNNGMAQASGKYLMFWDSDDYFDLTALEKMYNQCEADNADICVCGASRVVEGVDIPVREPVYLRMKMLPEQIPFNRKDIPKYILNFTNAAPWNKMFSRSFVERESIRYSSAQNAEDVFFVETALCCARTISVVNESLIVYRRDRVGSLTNTITDSYLVPLETWVETARELKRREVYPEESFANRALGNLIYMLRNQKNYLSFEGIVAALQDYALEELSLSDASVARHDWQRECLDIMLSGSAGDVLMYLMNYTYRKQTESAMRERLQSKENRILLKKLKKKDTEIARLKGAESNRAKLKWLKGLLGR